MFILRYHNSLEFRKFVIRYFKPWKTENFKQQLSTYAILSQLHAYYNCMKPWHLIIHTKLMMMMMITCCFTGKSTFFRHSLSKNTFISPFSVHLYICITNTLTRMTSKKEFNINLHKLVALAQREHIAQQLHNVQLNFLLFFLFVYS